MTEINEGITYRDSISCWWPDYDHAAEKCFSFVMRRITDLDLAVARVKNKSLCVQAGGHAGLWPRRLAGRFEQVITHECDPILFRCLALNVADLNNVRISDRALGSFIGSVKMQPRCSAGSWRVSDDGVVGVEQVTIDSLELPACGAIFLDIEGYEVEALKGSLRTIEKFSPVIMVEELPRSKEAIRAQLKLLGYRLIRTIHGDSIYDRAD